jgi:hypothetical protein
MNLFINSPSYYTQKFGVIDEIYTLSSVISKTMDISKYTDLIDTVGIVPIIAPSTENIKEIKKVSLPLRMASISLQINYEEFLNSGIETKKSLMVKNILDSLQVVAKKLKKQFDFERFEKDLAEVVNRFEENSF